MINTFSVPKLINGGVFSDSRGVLKFVNDFNMSNIVRMYHVRNSSCDIVRAWQGHKNEQKWFYCVSGSFLVNIVKVDDWNNPSLDLKVESYIMKSSDPTILIIPKGFVNGFKAIENNSELIIYSDKSLNESAQDDYRFDAKMWYNW